MRNIIILIVIASVGAIITFLIQSHVTKEIVKSEIGVYPGEFKVKVYNKMVEWVKKTFMWNLADSLVNQPYQIDSTITGPVIAPVKTNIGQDEWGQTAWSLEIAKGMNLEKDKEYGVGVGGDMNGHFWILASKFPAFRQAVESNANFIIETKGVELDNNVTYRHLKTMLETDLGINIENPYFKRYFNKYNKRKD